MHQPESGSKLIMFVRKILSVSQSYSDHKERKKVKIVPTWNEFQFLICHLYFADAQNPGVQGLKAHTEPSAGHKHLKVIFFKVSCINYATSTLHYSIW